MNENMIVGQKIKLTRAFVFGWAVLLAVAVIAFAINVVQYLGYREIQDKSLVAMTTAYELADENFDTSKYSTREEMCDYLHDKLEWPWYSNYQHSQYGAYYDDYYDAQCEVVRAAEKYLRSIVDFPSSWEGEYVFAYPDFFSYLLRVVEEHPFERGNTSVYALGVALAVALVVALPLQITYSLNRKKEIKLMGDSLVCKKISGKELEIPASRIQRVRKSFPKGISVRTRGVFFKVGLIKNNVELLEAVTDAMNKNKVAQITVGTEDEYAKIEKMKQLLDSGAITQEEFDAKKKHLLDL